MVRRELHRRLFSPVPWAREAVVGGESSYVLRRGPASKSASVVSSDTNTHIQWKPPLTFHPSMTLASSDVASTKSAISSWPHSSLIDAVVLRWPMVKSLIRVEYEVLKPNMQPKKETRYLSPAWTSPICLPGR